MSFRSLRRVDLAVLLGLIAPPCYFAADAPPTPPTVIKMKLGDVLLVDLGAAASLQFAPPAGKSHNFQISTRFSKGGGATGTRDPLSDRDDGHDRDGCHGDG